TLVRLRAQLSDSGETRELEARHADLTKRLAAKQAEKDRYVRTFAQGHISEEELETYMLDLKNQIENLRLLVESVDADLSRRREQAEIAETTHAWLLALRERLSDVEKNTEAAFQARRKLVRLLVAEVSAGEKREDGTSEVRITYRFDPPDEPETDRGLVVATVPNGTSLS
ncbi:MAG TPA: hypothetical protein VGR18_09355, partial [Rubrobacter sp.]|nr:hypothetical protein [Rubrobacter sp.]